MTKCMSRSLLAITSLFSASLFASPASTFSGVTNGAPSLEIISIPGGSKSSATSEIMSTTLKVPGEKKSLLIGVSLESGILLQKGKKGVTEACAGVDVTVKIDGQPVAPGTVKFNASCQRQTLTEQAIIDLCVDGSGVDDQGTSIPADDKITADECTFTDDDLDHLLDMTSANHFNFIAPDVGAGNHTITVEASVNASSSVKGSANAIINLGTLSVQVVKSAHKSSHDEHEHEHKHGGHGHDFDDLVVE